MTTQDDVAKGLLWRDGVDRRVALRRRLVLWTGITWLPLLLLSLFEGTAFGEAVEVPLLSDPIVYARLLGSLVLFLLAEPLVDRRTVDALRFLEAAGIIPAERRESWRSSLGRIRRWGDSRIPVITIALLALVMSWVSFDRLADGDRAVGVESSWFWSPTAGGEQATWAGLWYVFLSTTVYRFFAYRWIWRFTLWAVILVLLARVPLRLYPTHPDKVAGLDILWRAQGAFLVVAMGFGTSVSGGMAHASLFSGSPITDHYPGVVGFVIMGLVAVFAPMVLFAGQVLRARENAIVEYSGLAEGMSKDFREAWIERSAEPEGLLVDSVQPSAMADYYTVFEAVVSTRPIGPRGVIAGAALLAAPFAPLLLLQMPLKQLLELLARTLM